MEAYNKKGLDNIKVLAGKVLCVLTYEEDGQEVWTSGKVYRADQHKSGSWSIETNQGGIGLVPGNYLMDKFEDNFVDVSDKVIMSDVIRYCYEKGMFTPGYENGELYFNMQISPNVAEGFYSHLIPEKADYEDACKHLIKLDPDASAEDKKFALEEALDNLGNTRIASMIAKVIESDKEYNFPYETEHIYLTLQEYCKDVEKLNDYTAKILEEVRQEIGIEKE